ncbi:MAG: hypothetical protein AAGB93_02865 [Planctomycetota bacterium]
MDRLFHFLIGLPALAFVFVGASWFVAPSFAASNFDMALLEGRGLGTQIADLASFFLTLGACMLVGLRTGRPAWFYAAMMLMGFATVGRVVAWKAHRAALTADMIAVEVLLVVLLSIAITRTSKAGP